MLNNLSLLLLIAQAAFRADKHSMNSGGKTSALILKLSIAISPCHPFPPDAVTSLNVSPFVPPVAGSA